MATKQRKQTTTTPRHTVVQTAVRLRDDDIANVARALEKFSFLADRTMAMRFGLFVLANAEMRWIVTAEVSALTSLGGPTVVVSAEEQQAGSV